MGIESSLTMIAGLVTFLGVFGAWATYQTLRPKHYFRAWRGEYEWTYRMKKIGSAYKWKDPSDDATVEFTLDTAYAKKNPKNGALKFIGDVETGALVTTAAGTKEQIIAKATRLGALIQWQSNSFAFLYQNPKTVFKKLTDGRPQQIAKTVNAVAAPWWQPYVVPLAIVGVLIIGATLYFVYQIYSHGFTHTGS